MFKNPSYEPGPCIVAAMPKSFSRNGFSALVLGRGNSKPPSEPIYRASRYIAALVRW